MIAKDFFKTPVEDKWTIERLIGEGHNCLIYGRKEAGKSFLAWFLVKAVSEGKPFLGKFNSQKGSCIIVDVETPQSDLETRVKKILDMDSEVDFHLRPAVNFRFSNKTHVDGLKSKIDNLKPTLLVFDNLNALQGKFKIEESNTDVTKLRDIFDSFRENNRNLTIILLHHEGKDSTRGARGASAIEDMSATVIRVQRYKDIPFTFVIEPQSRKREAIEPFLVELHENNGKLDLEYRSALPRGSVKNPSVDACDIVEHLLLIGNKKTVKALKEELAGKLGECTIRRELKELVANGVLERGRLKHDLHEFSLNERINPNIYTTLIHEEMLKRGQKEGILQSNKSIINI
jgi:hypothetical protein